jgi:hypothetical protein
MDININYRPMHKNKNISVFSNPFGVSVYIISDPSSNYFPDDPVAGDAGTPQIRAVPSEPVDSSHRPSGENDNPFTQPLCAGSTLNSFPVRSDQKRIDPAMPPAARRDPSGETATEKIDPEYPEN